MKSVGDVDAGGLEHWLQRLGLSIAIVPDRVAIPGTYWGEPEAGIVGTTVYASATTPLHSLLHEASHILMHAPTVRHRLLTDAGGTDPVEESVCALQLALADTLPGYSAQRCLGDMDSWGYSFRQGSAVAWYSEDAPIARRRWPDHVRALIERVSALENVAASH
ncbi:MAG: hypothetical protein AAGC71_05955 [Pseudomonadota bacterium]